MGFQLIYIYLYLIIIILIFILFLIYKKKQLQKLQKGTLLITQANLANNFVTVFVTVF
jgi:hypothetical protein